MREGPLSNGEPSLVLLTTFASAYIAVASAMSSRALSTKAAPRVVRVSEALPTTQTNKVLKRRLQQEVTATDDPLWQRPGRDLAYERVPPV